MQMIVVGRALKAWPDFIDPFEKQGASITFIGNGKDALQAISKRRFDLLVAEEEVGDMAGLELIETIVTRQPMLNCAVVSSLSPEAYHEASEGLGILMQLPPKPGRENAESLINHLEKIGLLRGDHDHHSCQR